jgi:glutamate formiminotransferase/formiminotetrahydrofolate cyclodeaminase
MVGRLTVGKKKYAAVEADMWAMIEQAEALRKNLTEAVEKDSAAFDDLMTALKLPKETEEQQEVRNTEIRLATLHAARIPLDVALSAVEVMRLARIAVSQGNLNAISDGATGAALAKAALTGAGYNVRINLLSYGDLPEAKEMLAELARLEVDAKALEMELQSTLAERGGIGGA